MTTSTQTQLRRGTNSQVTSMTPAAGEVVVDTTNNRLNIGDGTTAGGIMVPNAKDIQQLTFIYPTVSGTGDAITLTATPVVGSYTAPLRLIFKAGANNTTATTVNVNGLGTKNIQKMLDGALAALVAGDIVSGGIYEIIYDGTQFQIQGLGQKTPATLPAAVTGTLSGASTVFTVDFTTYSSYAFILDGILLNSSGAVTVDASQNAGSSYVTAVRHSGSSSTVQESPNQDNTHKGSIVGTLSQNSVTGNAELTYNSFGGTTQQVGVTTFPTSAAINAVRLNAIGGGITFSAGNVVLQPIVKR